MRLIKISSENIDLAWKEGSKYILEALEHSDGSYSIEDIYKHLLDNTFLLWLFYNDDRHCAEGAMITEIVQYPRRRFCTILFLGADNLDDSLVLFEEFIKWARNHRCDSINMYGRQGWERRLKSLGFDKLFSVMEKKI